MYNFGTFELIVEKNGKKKSSSLKIGNLTGIHTTTEAIFGEKSLLLKLCTLEFKDNISVRSFRTFDIVLGKFKKKSMKRSKMGIFLEKTSQILLQIGSYEAQNY